MRSSVANFIQRIKPVMMEEDDYKKIDQHLQGELADDQQAAFEKSLKNDDFFAKTYKERRQMTSYLQASSKQAALEEKMAELGKEYFKTEKTIKTKLVKMPILRFGLAIAAAIVLLVMVWNPFSSTDLYLQFSNHPHLAMVEKSEGESTAQKAELAYNNGDYETAYQALSEVLKTEPGNFQAKLALGISALEIGRIEKAQGIFETLANSSSSFKTYGQWYLALSYIKQGENEKAKPILENLGNDEPLLKKKAKDLLLSF